MSYFTDNYRHIRLPLASDEAPGFRPAQLAAIYALGAHFFSRTVPGIVVMPTGSGKSAVLTAAPFILNATRVLVLTPSRLVREQLAENFRSLVDLRKLYAISAEAPSPRVEALVGYVKTQEEWEALRGADVVVATVPSVSPRPGTVADPPTDLFDLVLVDEAHHAPAHTWATLLRALSECRQALFTATPFRLDDKEIGGRIIFRYDLKRARDEGVFGDIRYEAVRRVSEEPVDVTIARAVAARFADDMRHGLQHLVMVRADTITRARELHELYSANTPLRLEFVKGSHSLKHVKSVIQKLERNDADGVVCVNMFGEGFNLPRLKIAGVHSPHKSLAVTLQFIGRFARGASGNIGTATFLAEPHESNVELGELYESGSTWRELVANLSDSRVEEEVATREMLESFQVQAVPALSDFSLYTLRPYNHVKVFAVDDNIDVRTAPGFPDTLEVIFSGISNPHGAAVYITRDTGVPAWSGDERFVDVSYDVFIFYYAAAHNLLFVCASLRRDTLYEKLVTPMTAGRHRPLSSNAVNRVLRDLQALRIFSLGMKTRNPLGRTESYQQRSGSHVDRSVQEVDGRRFDRGHIFATAIDRGEAVTIGVSTASRIWQNAHLRIPQILNVCDRLAAKIANREPFLTRTGLDLLSPGEDLREVPDRLVFAIWAQDTYADPPIAFYPDEDGVEVECNLLDLDIEIIESRMGYCSFTISNADVCWRGRFEIGRGPLVAELDTSETELLVRQPHGSALMAEYLAECPPTFYRDDLSRIEGASIFPHRGAEAPFAMDCIETIDWTAAGVDIHSEKEQTREGRSIFSWVEERVRTVGDQFMFCDDGPGEVADFITANLDADAPKVRFFHCKASTGANVGARQKDFHELCCQALRTSPWFNAELLMRRLAHRRTTNVPGMRVGGDAELAQLSELGMGIAVQYEVYLVQPGLARNEVSPQILEILAGISGHLHHAGAAVVKVIAS